MTIYNWEGAVHICHIDCRIVERLDGGHTHIMYPAYPNSTAGRYQSDRNRRILTMGKGARAAMRATGQHDTRTNREWAYARKLYKESGEAFDGTATSDAEYGVAVNRLFGDRRPYVKRSIRSRDRLKRYHGKLWELSVTPPLSISRPPYLAGSEHDPNL